MLTTLWRHTLFILRYGLALVLGLVLLYAVVPVPYTGMMMERQLEAWWNDELQ